MRIVGVLLAAGEGARFGGGKLLARVPRTAHGVAAGTAIGAASG
jgi:CTP:molybdopterin cytidylyltransferase MocA